MRLAKIFATELSSRCHQTLGKVWVSTARIYFRWDENNF